MTTAASQTRQRSKSVSVNYRYARFTKQLYDLQATNYSAPEKARVTATTGTEKWVGG